ncbi:sensor histidine kinase [Arenibacter latericius]|uniref:sensor histidine kinase n=1 Tax=Arenibacter latericius TaxID=86104 RepID=UPI00040245B9|nr:histidine kinase [Arenibacter latericius]
MKRIILLVLILAVTPFLIISEKPLNQQVEEISRYNSKQPEFRGWEYIKNRAFNKNGTLQKGYDKPVIIQMERDATFKDSIIVDGFIKKLNGLLPTVRIGFNSDSTWIAPIHNIIMGFRKDTLGFRTVPYQYYDRFLRKKHWPDGTVIGINNFDFFRTNDGNKHSWLAFKFDDNISDSSRKKLIEYELWDRIFSTPNMLNSYNQSFEVGIFNKAEHQSSLGWIGELDLFLLQKLYSTDFMEQFGEYMYNTYPWRYATYLIDRTKARFTGMLLSFTLGVIVLILGLRLLYMKKYKYTFFKYLIPLLVVFLSYNCLNNLFFYFAYPEAFTYLDAYLGYFFTSLIVVTALALLLYLLDKIFIRENLSFALQLLLKVSFVILTGCLFTYGLYLLANQENNLVSIYSYENYIKLILFLAFGRGFLIYLNHFSDSLVKQKDVELSHLKEINAQAELKLLQSHINPHFLYNALNSIAALAHDDAGKTEKMALSLSDLFRYSINKKGEKMSTVSEEVTLVENYLEIEKIRFGERLEFTLTIDEDAKQEKIPMFMLQPLIENAIKHGVSKIGGEAKISLDIKKEDKGLLITVGDNGPAFPQGLVSGHGLQTVYDLLRLSYGDKASLSWENEPKKQIVISINNR